MLTVAPWLWQNRRQENTVCDVNETVDKKLANRPLENGWLSEETETMMKEHVEKESAI